MSKRELCAAFYLLRPDPEPEMWTADMLAGIGAARSWIWSPAGGPTARPSEIRYAVWGGLQCEVRVRDLEHLRSVAVVFRQSAFLDLFTLDGTDLTESEAAVRLAEAFRGACAALAPEAACLTTAPREDIDGFVAELESPVLTLDERALFKGPFGLLYLPRAAADGVRPALDADPRDELAVPGGRLFFAGTGSRRWFS